MSQFKPYADLTFDERTAKSIEWKAKRLEWPDFIAYDKQDYFQLFEAACLTFDLLPKLLMPAEAQSLYNLWKEEYLAGDANRLAVLCTTSEAAGMAVNAVYDGIDHTFHPHMKISRDRLNEWFTQRGMRPRFLFKDRRV